MHQLQEVSRAFYERYDNDLVDKVTPVRRMCLTTLDFYYCLAINSLSDRNPLIFLTQFISLSHFFPPPFFPQICI